MANRGMNKYTFLNITFFADVNSAISCYIDRSNLIHVYYVCIKGRAHYSDFTDFFYQFYEISLDRCISISIFL